MAQSDPGRPARRPSLAARLLGGSARGAQALADVAGIDDAVELATEEAIVRALESQAVERAIVRVIEGPATEEAMQRLLSSPALERAIMDALDSELVDRVWERLLASDEAQKLVERIAEAPEVRAAVAAQGVGLIEDLGRQVRRVADRLDDVIERVVRGLFRRPPRLGRTDRAGLVTRALGLAIDAGLINLAFVATTALVAMVAGVVFPGSDGASTPALVLGAGAWIITISVYLLFFWTLAGQTPGMRLLGIRLECGGGERRLSPRRAIRRLVGIGLSVLTLGLGFSGVLFSDRRRGLHDRMADTEIVPDDRRLIAPWSGPAPGATVA